MIRRFVWIGVCVLLVACGSAPTVVPTPTAPASSTATTDLSAIKTYLESNIAELQQQTQALAAASQKYYDLAQAQQFDYAALWAASPDEVRSVLNDAKQAWLVASPGYEQVEGIVAGVDALAQYDIILDAGTSGAEGGDSVVPFDLKLADGRTLPKPGNLFGVLESTLWGTEPSYITAVQPDLDGNDTLDFGEAMPDAAVLLAASDTMNRYVGELATEAQAWQPTETEAFTALVVMVPTMNEYFESWKQSRFVAGAGSTQRDFVAISRLADMQDILGGLQVVYASLSPQVGAIDAAQDQQIAQGLDDLKTFIAGIYQREQAGEHFSAEDADLLGHEAQHRATTITGQIAQVAARLDVAIEQ